MRRHPGMKLVWKGTHYEYRLKTPTELAAEARRKLRSG
jgi:hypothetical protein